MQVPISISGLPPGQQPSPEQIQAIQRQIVQDAQKYGMTVPQFLQMLKAKQILQMQHQQKQQGQQSQPDQGPPSQTEGQQQAGDQPQQAQQQQQQAQPQPAQPAKTTIPLGGPPPPPKPEALAVANFLRNQDLKTRVCFYEEKRRDLFRVKRAIRVLMSPEYEKARKKNSLLPEISDRSSAENVFKLLPMSLLALQVTKADPHQNHGHAKEKRVKGLWTVKVVVQQGAEDDSHYVWLYEGSQTKQKLYSAAALIGVVTIVMFPLWPLVLRQGVWYLSMGLLGLVGLFFALAIFRLILFCITAVTVSPGLWLYPNLFEDVGFFDSFRPIWGWQETSDERRQKQIDRRERRALKRSNKDSSAEKTGEAAASSSSPTAPAAAPQEKSANAAPPALQPVEMNGNAKETGATQQAADSKARASFQAYVEED